MSKHNYNEQTNNTSADTTAPAIEISEIVVQQAKEEVQREKQTIVHCRTKCGLLTPVRISPNTYLIENVGAKRKLISAIGIAVAPEWGDTRYSKGYKHYTLIFEGLSKDCGGFYLKEVATPGETDLFYSEWTERNNSDVYELEILIER